MQAHKVTRWTGTARPYELLTREVDTAPMTEARWRGTAVSLGRDITCCCSLRPPERSAGTYLYATL